MTEAKAAGRPTSHVVQSSNLATQNHHLQRASSAPQVSQMHEEVLQLLPELTSPRQPSEHTADTAPLDVAQNAAPPPRRRSPYFHNTDSPQAPPIQETPQESSPPSRTPSASTVRFPKLGPRSALHAPSPAPASPLRTTSLRRNTKPGSGDRVSVHALDTPEERALFPFKEFNDMQSAVFQTAYRSDENIVVSAPTGSGKTVVFELAFLRMLQFKSSSFIPLAIYMAPTKALCSERLNDWRDRFKSLNVKCIELTGDTEVYNIRKYTDDADLIITTPEKWDSVTRRTYLTAVQNRLCLAMIDEVHTLSEERGPTLEVVVSRMKKRSDALRFVAVSATVPNIDDVARWIGSKEDLHEESRPLSSIEYDDIEQMPKARVFKFGDEFRPVPLQLHTVGVDAPNEFALGSRLDKELWRVLNQYTDGLPTLVFCPTRKACQSTAEHLFKEYTNALANRTRLPWDATDNQPVVLKDAKIQKLTELGIAVHHAGLDLLDRRNIEQAFRNSQLHLLVATSTLAVGVNLPAHLVVIKGTSCWAGQGFREYSDIDIQQMMGRAGRPQFDNSGTVVIMCNNTKLHKFQSMLHSKTVLESCLHQHLTEHINSEIGLGTIGSLQNAQEWLRGTFLSIRIRQNPRHYQGTMTKDYADSWDGTLDRFVETSLRDLKKRDFITDDPEIIKEKSENGAKELLPTRLGEVMSQNFISYKTMCHIINMDADSGVRDLLELLAGATEFSSLRIRQGEGALLNKLRVHRDVRYHIDTPVKTYADKVFLLAQVAFGNVSLDDFSTKTENTAPLQTMILIFNAAPRIARAIFNVACHLRYGAAARAALELCHVVNGKAWEDSSTVFRQIDKIGPKSIAVLQTNGVHTFDDLLKLAPSRLEMWLNRHPPFGSEVLERAAAFPRFSIGFTENGVDTDENGFPTLSLRLQIKNTGQLVHKSATSGGGKSRKTRSYNLVILILSTKDDRFIDKRMINTARLSDRVREFPLDVTLYHPDEGIMCVVGVEEKSGLSRTYQYTPRIPANMFPKAKTIERGIQSADVSEDEELIDLTAPQKVKDKKRGRQEAANPKSKTRRLALAARSVMADETIDDDEDAVQAGSPASSDTLDVMSDSPRPSKSARWEGKVSASAESPIARKLVKSSTRSAMSGSCAEAGNRLPTVSSSQAPVRRTSKIPAGNSVSKVAPAPDAAADPPRSPASMTVDEQFEALASVNDRG